MLVCSRIDGKILQGRIRNLKNKNRFENYYFSLYVDFSNSFLSFEMI